jgi:hypothetical protein
MKKILCAFVVLNLLLISCTNNDNTTSAQENLILPKTITITYPNFPQDNSKSTIIYDGNKIISITNATSKTKFTYDGNVIVKQEFYKLGSQGIEIISKRIVYEYENGKLKSKIATSNFDSSHPDGDYIRKEVFTYRTDGVTSYSQLDVSVQTKVETKRGDVNLTYKLGNLIKLEEINADPNIANTIFVFEYDSKNNPLKNILGFDLLNDDIDNYGINNILKTTIKGRLGISEAVFNSTCIYNTNGYPTKFTSFTGDGKTPEYEIEYTY